MPVIIYAPKEVREDTKGIQVRTSMVIRITGNVRHDLQFIKGFVGIASNVPDGEVIEVLIKMF